MATAVGLGYASLFYSSQQKINSVFSLLDGLQNVYEFLTGSFIVSANWKPGFIKATFHHREQEDVHRRPFVRTCETLAQITLPVAASSEELVQFFEEAMAQLKFGFTIA